MSAVPRRAYLDVAQDGALVVALARSVGIRVTICHVWRDTLVVDFPAPRHRARFKQTITARGEDLDVAAWRAEEPTRRPAVVRHHWTVHVPDTDLPAVIAAMREERAYRLAHPVLARFLAAVTR